MDFEGALRRYRPSGPPAGLRDRVVGGEPVGRPFQGRHWRDWLYPIAAAAAAMTFYALTDSTHRRVISATSQTSAEREAAIADIAIELGGDETALLEAARLIGRIESPGVDAQGPAAIEESIP